MTINPHLPADTTVTYIGILLRSLDFNSQSLSISLVNYDLLNIKTNSIPEQLILIYYHIAYCLGVCSENIEIVDIDNKQLNELAEYFCNNVDALSTLSINKKKYKPSKQLRYLFRKIHDLAQSDKYFFLNPSNESSKLLSIARSLKEDYQYDRSKLTLLRIESESHVKYEELADISILTGDLEEASKFIKMALMLNKNSAPALYLYGYLMIGDNKLSIALEYLDKSLSLIGQNGEVSRNIIFIYLWNRQYSKVVELLTRDVMTSLKADLSMALDFELALNNLDSSQSNASEIKAIYHKLYCPSYIHNMINSPLINLCQPNLY